MMERVGGTLAVTRAFGDHSLRKLGVIPTPHVKKYALRPSDGYLVIASDGLWDIMSD
jgi:serine/threonine protein phosphatase PrpC